MKYFIAILVVFLLVSCDYLNLQKKEKNAEKPLATVFNSKLYKVDIVALFPKNVSKGDSLVFVKSLIENWAIKELLFVKASENSSQKENENIKGLVQKYRESLLINSYKEKLIKQQLDTLVSVSEIEEFYKENSRNFRLNEELVQMKYLHLNKDIMDRKEFVSLFKSNDLEDLILLEKEQLSFKSHHFNDSVWVRLDNVLLKVPFSKKKLLKKSKFLQKVDSIGLYLVAVKGVLKRNDIAPLSYISSTIKQLILHKRKLELIRKIEKIILQDAVQNKSFTIY